MHDLQATAAKCKMELERLGIAICNIRGVELDKRARRTWGTCRKFPDGSFRIGISPKLLQAPLEALENTLYHEYLHAATDCKGHRGRWKQLAERVNRSLGTSISCTASWQDQGLDQKTDPTVRYRFTCTGCGAEVIRFRACAFTQNPGRYRCRRCGGSFRPIHTP